MRRTLTLPCGLDGGAVKRTNEDGLTVGKAEDFARWYSEVVVKSEMIEYYDVSGTKRPPPPLHTSLPRLCHCGHYHCAYAPPAGRVPCSCCQHVTDPVLMAISWRLRPAACDTVGADTGAMAMAAGG